jgi:hypothetical protein
MGVDIEENEHSNTTQETSRNLTPPEENYGDTLHTLARAGISLIPYIGGPAAELFSLIITPPIDKRRHEWMEEIAETLKKLADDNKIALETLKDNPTFIDAVLQATPAAIRSHQRIKRHALRNAVLNSALARSPDASTQLMFISFVDRFTEWHIRILELFSNPPQWATRNNVSFAQFGAGGLGDILLQAFPQLKERKPFYQQVWADLHNCGLLNTSSLGMMLTGGGLMAKRTTDFGDQFLSFISEPGGKVSGGKTE